MLATPIRYAFALMAATNVVPGCVWRDRVATTSASEAQAQYEQGRLGMARQSIRKAIAARDDVSDYWILLGRIEIGSGNARGAYDAYQTAIQLDRGNLEAVTQLCQLALYVGRPDDADKYADQLLLMQPGSYMPVAVKAGAALARGDKAKARELIDQVLANVPDDIRTLMLKSRLLSQEGKYAEAAAVAEAASHKMGSQPSQLRDLMRLYEQAGAREGYERTMARIAEAQPEDTSSQLAYADMLYANGDGATAAERVKAAMLRKPDDIALASAILALWLDVGPSALPADRIVAEAASTSLEMKAAYAQFANEIGRPDLALATLKDVSLTSGITVGNANAVAAKAYALGVTGQRPQAMAALERILASDPSHPRALLSRGRLREAAGDSTGAITDVRKVLSDDPGNVTVRITLANMLENRGDKLLGESVLRQGLSDNAGQPRLAAHLARKLIAWNRRDDARDAIRDMVRAAPLNQRARAVAAQFGVSGIPTSAPAA